MGDLVKPSQANVSGSVRRASEVMAALGIVQLGSPVLSSPTRLVSFPEDEKEVLRIAGRLSAVADAVERVHVFVTGAMGLAAPQINEPRSIAIFRAIGSPELVLVNPRVVLTVPAAEEDWSVSSEGCLSFFDFRCCPRRPDSLVLRYQTVWGESVEKSFEVGRLAGDVLHEVDHLNGVLCLDRVDPRNPVCSIAVSSSVSGAESIVVHRPGKDGLQIGRQHSDQ